MSSGLLMSEDVSRGGARRLGRGGWSRRRRPRRRRLRRT
jgi:hypothetical protein